MLNTVSVNAIDAVISALGEETGIPEAEGGLNRIRLMQKLSPQLDPDSEHYVPGAKLGDYVLKGLPDPIVPGAQGFICQPLGVMPCWLTWDNGKALQFAEKPLETQGDFYAPTGEEIVFVKYLYLALNCDITQVWAYVVKGGGFKPFNELLTAIKWQPPIVLPDGRRWAVPIFGQKLKVTSQAITNRKGDYKAAKYEIVGRYPEAIDEAQLTAGLAAYQAIERQVASLRAATLPEPPKPPSDPVEALPPAPKNGPAPTSAAARLEIVSGGTHEVSAGPHTAAPIRLEDDIPFMCEWR
jgi:hypothetical protein